MIPVPILRLYEIRNEILTEMATINPNKRDNSKQIEAIARERANLKKQKLEKTSERESSSSATVIHREPVKAIDFKRNFLLVKFDSEEENLNDGITVKPTIKGQTIPKSIRDWDDERLPTEIFFKYYEQNHSKLGSPTPIQSKLWPVLLRGEDSLAVAPTGSGKTLAFALPLAAHVKGNQTHEATLRALVLSPTRELAKQIYKVMRKFKDLYGVKVGVSYGGDKKTEELGGCSILVSTPGRGLDIASSGEISMSSVSFVVIDEADKMLQFGLRDDVEALLGFIPVNRQTVLTSATWTQTAVAVASEWLRKDRVEINVGVISVSHGRIERKHDQSTDGGDLKVEESLNPGVAGSLTLAKDIEQVVHVCAEHKKPRKLIRHIEKVRKSEVERGESRNPGAMIVFCNHVKTVLFVYEFLARQSVRVVAIHGSMLQQRRESALEEFRAGKYNCLVATDVAGRGLHISNLVHVVNYDFPTSLSQYVHRVGRCGRGRHGTAFSFFTRNLSVMAPDLVSLLIACGQEVDPNLKAIADEISAFRDQNPSPEKNTDDQHPHEEPSQPLDMDSDEQTSSECSDSELNAQHESASEVSQDLQIVFDDSALSVDDNEEEVLQDSKFDSAGAMPLRKFQPFSKEHHSRAPAKKTFKRARGKRGGKKSKGRRTS